MRIETNSGGKTAGRKETEVMDEAVMLPLNHRRREAGRRKVLRSQELENKVSHTLDQEDISLIKTK